MPAADDLRSAILAVVGQAAREVTRAEERLLGHEHAVALGTVAQGAANGASGDAFRTALGAACDLFMSDLDARYHYGTPPHPSGLSWATFADPIGGCCSLSAQSALRTIEEGRGHAYAGHVTGAVGDMVSALASSINGTASYLNALQSLVAALDARYVAGVTTAPVENAGRGLATALTLLATQAAGAYVDTVEGANGHSGHASSHRSETIAAAVSACQIDLQVANVMAILDARYHWVGDE